MADATGGNESITEIVPKALGKYLKDAVGMIREYYQEFPSTNRRIQTPSVSLISSVSEFRPGTPYLEQKPEAGTPVNSKANVNWVVGLWDFTLQVDLWAGSKEERDDLFDAVFNALNPEINPMGLNLTLTEYFDQICDYSYVGHDLADSEEEAQRDEWRITLNILATCKAIRTRKEFIIEDTDTAAEIEAQGQIDSSVVVTE